MNKFYIVQITDINGEIENTTSCLMTALEDEIADKADNIAKTWYGDDAFEEDDDGTYWFNNGCAVYLDCYKEISEPTFNELKPILAVLLQ